MVNKHNQIVCDLTNTILEDGITLFPGYVEIKDNFLIRYDSDDPNNVDIRKKPWILHHRVEYKTVAHKEICADERLQGKHFMSKVAMNKYLTEHK